PSEFVVDVGMPVREEDDRMESRPDEVLDLRTDDEGRADVHEPGRLESDVGARGAGSIEEGPQLVAGDDFLGTVQDGLEPFLRGRPPPHRTNQAKGFNPPARGVASIR